MAIISFDKDAPTDYIPAYGGNRDSENPCVVSLRFVPYSRVQHYSKIISTRARGINDPGKISELSREVQKQQFCENVDSISGYFIGQREVTSPDEFYDTADTDLVLEIIKAMESSARLTDGQRKN